MLTGQLNESLVGDTAGTDKDHAVRGVVGLDVLSQVRALDGLDVLAGAEDGAAKGLALESGGVQVVEDDFLQLLVDLLLFAKDDGTFALDGALVELGVLQDIGKDVDGLGDVGVEGLGVVDGAFSLMQGK